MIRIHAYFYLIFKDLKYLHNHIYITMKIFNQCVNNNIYK